MSRTYAKRQNPPPQSPPKGGKFYSLAYQGAGQYDFVPQSPPKGGKFYSLAYQGAGQYDFVPQSPQREGSFTPSPCGRGSG